MRKIAIETVRSEDSELWINGDRIDAAIDTLDVFWDDEAEVWVVNITLLAAQVLAGYTVDQAV